jgi:hypothetical protein
MPRPETLALFKAMDEKGRILNNYGKALDKRIFTWYILL